MIEHLVTRTTAFIASGIVAATCVLATVSLAQQPRQKVRIVTVPISIFSKEELRKGSVGEILDAETITLRENKIEQQILSIRSVADTPISLAILIQEDLTSNVSLQLPEIAKFIRELPRGSRVMVAYTRAGGIQINQRFTEDLEKASKALRVVGSSISSGNGPYEALIEVAKRFEGLPQGRRAVLVVSDGVVANRGGLPFSITQSPEIDRAIIRLQRASIATYAFYSPTAATERGNNQLILAGQSALERLSDETGGKSYFQGTIAPISFEPFFREVNQMLGRQFSLTYLSTGTKSGFQTIEVKSSNPNIRIEHPRGIWLR